MVGVFQDSPEFMYFSPLFNMGDSLNVKPNVALFKYFRQIVLLNISRNQNNKSFVSF